VQKPLPPSSAEVIQAGLAIAFFAGELVATNVIHRDERIVHAGHRVVPAEEPSGGFDILVTRRSPRSKTAVAAIKNATALANSL
jgi:hypothetical protein